MESQYIYTAEASKEGRKWWRKQMDEAGREKAQEEREEKYTEIDIQKSEKIPIHCITYPLIQQKRYDKTIHQDRA